jgi:hypothetical protein
MILVKQGLREADKLGVWDFRLPQVAATEDLLVEAEHGIGYPVDPEYRAFLRTANGWPAFYQSVDLFGTEELLGRGSGARGKELLTALDESPIALTGRTRGDLAPVAAARQDIDLFVVSKRDRPSPVWWLAHDLIEVFPTFGQFFLAMVAYNERESEALRSVR